MRVSRQGKFIAETLAHGHVRGSLRQPKRLRLSGATKRFTIWRMYAQFEEWASDGE
jgi:hypothetical protein